jgi:choline dehydrogenase-like flavoprotein
MAILQGRAVGGTTVVNWTTCFRTPERVMQHWAEHHGVEGLTHEALVPHWEEIERRLNVQQMRLDQVNANNLVTWRGLDALGWHKDLLFRNVKNCAHTGYCGMGCVIDAKQSMLVTYIPEAVRAGAEVYANAWVERLTFDGRHVTGVIARVRNPVTDAFNDRTITVRARVTVLAGGAINSPSDPPPLRPRSERTHGQAHVLPPRRRAPSACTPSASSPSSARRSTSTRTSSSPARTAACPSSSRARRCSR